MLVSRRGCLYFGRKMWTHVPLVFRFETFGNAGRLCPVGWPGDGGLAPPLLWKMVSVPLKCSLSSPLNYDSTSHCSKKNLHENLKRNKCLRTMSGNSLNQTTPKKLDPQTYLGRNPTTKSLQNPFTPNRPRLPNTWPWGIWTPQNIP